MIPAFELPYEQSASMFILLKKSDDALSIVVGAYSGFMFLADLVDQNWNVYLQEQVFKRPVRSILSLPFGSLLTASASGRLALIDSDNSITALPRPKDQEGQSIEISSMCLLDQQGSGTVDLAIGDDYGNVYILQYNFQEKAWTNSLTMQEQDDSISSMLYNSHRKTLLAASGDGTILILDLKKNKIVAHTSSLDDEILALTLDGAGDVLCTTGLGAIVRYKWGYWGKIASRLKPALHSSSPVNTMALHPSLNDIAFTGTADGILRRLKVRGDISVDVALDTFDDSIDSLQTVELCKRPYCALLKTSDRSIRFLPLDQNDKAAEEKPKKKARTKPQTDQLDSFFADL